MLRERRLRLAVVAGTTAALVAVAAASATGATANTL
jgi:hypothetical protein